MKTSFQISKNPLCVFCLSPPFSIRAFTRPPERSASRRLSVRSWRRGDSSLFSVRSRFKPFKRRSCVSLTKYLTGFFANRKKKTLVLPEILEEIRKAWIPRQLSGKSCCSKTMEEKWSKSSSSSNEMLSPVLLRRRLSAPETIMRKHMLAQRSESQDDVTSHPEAKIQYRNELESGSDSNLSRKRDPDLMRKTTLLRRLWNHSKPLTSRFSGSFYEWQHWYGKLYSGRSTHSLTSVHSSPEHLVRSQSKRLLNEEFRTSPQHKPRKISPKHQIYETKRKNTESESTSTTTTTPKTTTETERYTSYTTFSDNSDSAYTNSRSNFSESTNNNISTPSEIRKDIIEDTEVSNQDFNTSLVKNPYVKYSANETATQTVGTTNVNVISNVQLSQSTLDLIFNQVIQDVKKQSSEVEVSEAKVVQVKQIPSFFLKRDETVDNSEHSRIVKCMIGNVGIGSNYTKPPELPHIAVPRFSARPHTSSMEVNISSGESTDKESDTISLVDSLEDTSSLRTDPMQNEVIANRSDMSLELPDNSDKKLIKPTAFFIPIEVDSKSELKPVSDHLPMKVRNRLARRQQKREEKIQSKSSSRSDSNYISASENGNHIHLVDNRDVNLNNVPLPEVNYTKKKRINKPLLPSIESFRRIKIDRSRHEDRRETRAKSVKRKSAKENLSESSYSARTKQTQWTPKLKTKNEKLSPLYTSKNEYVYDYGPRRIYHKTEFNNSSKRIEILEIMECVDTEKQSFSKTKSKIPVLVNQKLPKINQKKAQKPAFLDLDSVPISDPKLDQLIANILIETLNMPDLASGTKSQQDETKSAKSPSSKSYRRFEVIPEELSFQSSTENNDASNNNEVKNEEGSYKGKAAIAVVKDENFSSIPKGWITFYMLHNNRGSPDSTSDEGKKLETDLDKNECNKEQEETVRKNLTSSYSNVTYDVVKRDKCSYESNGNCSSSSEVQTKTLLPPSNGRYKKFNNQRKQRHKNNEMEVKHLGKDLVAEVD